METEAVYGDTLRWPAIAGSLTVALAYNVRFFRVLDG